MSSEKVINTRDEHAELESLKDQIFEQMQRQNDIREREVAAIEEKTKTDLERLTVEREKTAQLVRQADVEAQKVRATEQLIQEIRTLIAIVQAFITKDFPEHGKQLLDQQRDLSTLIEIMKFILPHFLRESGREDEALRLADILKSFATKGDIHVGGTTVKGDAGDINVAETGGTAKQK